MWKTPVNCIENTGHFLKYISLGEGAEPRMKLGAGPTRWQHEEVVQACCTTPGSLDLKVPPPWQARSPAPWGVSLSTVTTWNWPKLDFIKEDVG